MPRTTRKVELRSARAKVTPWRRASQPKEVPYFAGARVRSLTVHDRGEFTVSEVGCRMDGRSRGGRFVFDAPMNGMASRDVTLHFGANVPPDQPIRISEEVVGGEEARRELPAPSHACTVQLQGHVVLIDVPNAPSEFRVMLYDTLLPARSVGRMLVVRDMLQAIPDRYHALRNEMDASVPAHDASNSFNFSKVLQTALVFDEPCRKAPIVRVAYYAAERGGAPIYPLYGSAVKGVTRRGTRDAYHYEVDANTGRRRDLGRY